MGSMIENFQCFTKFIQIYFSRVDSYVHFSGHTFVYGIPGRNSLQIATSICHFSQYLGTKFHTLFKIAKSNEIVIILGKTAMLS